MNKSEILEKIAYDSQMRDMAYKQIAENSQKLEIGDFKNFEERKRLDNIVKDLQYNLIVDDGEKEKIEELSNYYNNPYLKKDSLENLYLKPGIPKTTREIFEAMLPQSIKGLRRAYNQNNKKDAKFYTDHLEEWGKLMRFNPSDIIFEARFQFPKKISTGTYINLMLDKITKYKQALARNDSENADFHKDYIKRFAEKAGYDSEKIIDNIGRAN